MKCINSSVCEVGTSDYPPVRGILDPDDGNWSCGAMVSLEADQLEMTRSCTPIMRGVFTHMGMVEELKQLPLRSKGRRKRT